MEGNDEKDNGQRQTNCRAQIFTFLQFNYLVHCQATIHFLLAIWQSDNG
jgi:hypothetical protein